MLASIALLPFGRGAGCYHAPIQSSVSGIITDWSGRQLMDRATWLRHKRCAAQARMDTRYAPIYDEYWGAIEPTHQRMLACFLALCPAQAQILDAACGTGKYWPLLLAGQRRVYGIDQSAGMLQQARAKFPDMPFEQLGLQELTYVERFDGVICMDSLELVCPEEWPLVLVNLRRALRPDGLLSATIELPEPDLPEVYAAAVAEGLPVVPGEYVKAGGYHFYPDLNQARGWLAAAGFTLFEDVEGDGYQHILARAV
jgi:SAM-dependent methyltransferase